MSRIRWPLLILLVCLPLILLAAGYKLPGLSPSDLAEPEPVPAGDREIAWFNTTTGGAAWERFVAGVRKAERLVPGLHVDDRRAFPQQTTETAEVVLSFDQRPAKLRIRWYKLTSDRNEAYWISKLAQQSPATLAVIGGGSSDRARDLALALNRQAQWRGERPLFFITTATAEKVYLSDIEDAERPGANRALLDIYSGRTFRVCFSNQQMAEALLDFVCQNPALRPRSLDDDAHLALGSGSISLRTAQPPPAVFRVAWEDDPYSGDLLEQFGDALPGVLEHYGADSHPGTWRWDVPFSVGGFATPNRHEDETAASILGELRRLPMQRTLLVMPAAPAPARRLLRALCEAEPTLGQRIVVVNGDGMGVNSVLRDGEYVWPIRSLPVPLLLFTHANPVGWDVDLKPPSSTEDVLHAAELIRLIATAAYEPAMVSGADELAARLRTLDPPFFENNGNRRGGSGEYVLLLTPNFAEDHRGATTEVWRRDRDRAWHRVPMMR
jgi:hypothetical protein